MSRPEARRVGGADLAHADEPTLRALLARDPGDVDASLALADVLAAAGRLGDALPVLDHALDLQPDHAGARAARGALNVHLGRFEQARTDLLAAGRARADDAALASNLGFVLERLDDRAGALDAYDRALALDPDCVPALLNRGALHGREGRLDRARADAERLCALHPDAAEPHYRRAESLLADHLPAPAREAAERCLAIDPAHVRARVALGVALAMTGRLVEADDALARARSQDARAAEVASTMVPFASNDRTLVDSRLVYLYEGYYRLGICDWRDYDEYCARFRELIADAGAHPAGALGDAMLAFMAHAVAVPGTLIARHAARVAGALTRGVPRVAAPRFVPRGGRRLRIGYLSANFSSHVNAHNVRVLFEHADRERFEVHGYALMPPGDGASARAMIAGCERFRDLSQASDAAAADRIRDDACDIVVHLTGYTANARAVILAHRPAPIRVSYQGYWSTLGPGMVDYHFTDRHVSPPDEGDRWHEARLFLPRPAFLYHARPMPDDPPSRAGEGLPTDAVVLACFSRTNRIDPGVFDVWMRVLERTPGTVLWLLAAGDRARGNLRREAAVRGVDPDRLVFADEQPLERHVARCALADLFLDTRACNGHTTVFDALERGVPVVTWRGDTPYARIASGLADAAGIGDLAAGTLGAYESTAARLASDARARERAAAAIHARRASLLDERRMVRAVERAYEVVWDRLEAGLEPADVAVDGVPP